jgi:site-specific recombinase XerD
LKKLKEDSMLATYFKRQATRTTYYASSAGPYLDEFTDWLAHCGFREEVIGQYLPGVVEFANWVDAAYGNLVSCPDDVVSRFCDNLAKRGRLRYSSGQHSISYLGARHFVEFLQIQHKIIGTAKSQQAAQPDLLRQFDQWMQAHRGVMPATLRNYQLHIIDLLRTLGECPERFTAAALHTFILSYARGRSHALAKKRVTATRMFIRFLIATGRCQPGIEAAIPAIAEWPLAKLPRYLPGEEVERVLACTNDVTPTGIRDKAILLLLARLGLRASEVAELALSDIDWSAGTFSVIGKSRRESKLPLPQEVGDAMLKYLNGIRPPVETNRVFITAIAPWIPITRYVVKHVAAQAIRRAGISAPSFGAHVLRHSAATGMLRQGASLQVIGEVLRHRCLETTAHYAKVDMSLLLQVTRPWPGATSC